MEEMVIVWKQGLSSMKLILQFCDIPIDIS